MNFDAYLGEGTWNLDHLQFGGLYPQVDGFDP